MSGRGSLLSLRELGCSWCWRAFFSGVWFDRNFKPWLRWRLNVGPLHIVRRNDEAVETPPPAARRCCPGGDAMSDKETQA
jgi:hypothetical protein